ncbi:PDZ domain-containing protein [bacterium]|nr:PDZ domain-containing protein [bacterium]
MNEISNKKNIVSYIMVLFIGALIMYAVVYFFPTSITENVTKLEKDVTVTDTGIADAVEKVYDSVVIVSTYKDNVYSASGTGFVYQKEDNKYYILTNHHVIDGGNKVTVTFTDGKVLETKVVGSDQYADIAVLSLETKEDVKIAPIGKSESTRVGDTSFAVGAPLDSAYSWTVTRGIVSGKDRMVEVSLDKSSQNDYVMKVLQTDAAINSGNSGGPLCNSNGEVIGITSLKLVSSGVEGMGFAIPIENAIKKAEQIIKGETANYPYIGISMLDLSKAYYSYQYYDLIKESNLSSGVIVVDVEKGSPASKAGLKSNDIITNINGEEVKNVAYLRYYLYQNNINDEIKLTIFRDGKKQDITVKLGTNKQTT